MSSKDIDRLSTLPEEIISRILSLMPTESAVRTCILSTRWRYSWTFVINLDLDELRLGILSKFQKFVDGVLQSCRSPQIQLFRLRLISYYSKKCFAYWIDKAVSLNVCELDIQARIAELPLNLLTCKTLTKLTLDHCSRDYSFWKPPCQPVNLPCLKTLDIVVNCTPLVNVFKLINGCPILESLSLEIQCHEVEEDYIFNLPTLKRLKLTKRLAMGMNKVVLHVPNLEYLFVGGELNLLFIMEDVSGLVEASLSFDHIRMKDCCWVKLLKGLYGVKLLTLNSRCTYFVEQLTCPLPVFLNMELLDLTGFSLQLVSSFLASSPHLKHLCIEKAEGLSWTEPEFVPSCMLTNLATIKFSHCNGDKADIEFLEYMLRNAEVLKTVTIIWGNLCTEEQMRFAAEVRNFPRASSHCEIYFL